jgi:type VI secretion system protein ImpE
VATSPEESVRGGELAQALQTLQSRVRANPADAKDRVFLFQLLAILGQWDRALTQLNVAGDLDPSTLVLRQVYRQALEGEAARRSVFESGTAPVVLGEPSQWLAGLLDALRLAADGHWEKAAELRAQSLEAAPATAGSIDGRPFEWIADADSRIGPCLEIIIDGKYMWAPFERVQSIQMEAPTDLRDVVWTQAIATWSNGGRTTVLIPTRYAGIDGSQDPALLMSRRTEWQEQPGDTFLGTGQRMLATDTGEYPLLEIREIVLTTDG